MQWRGIRQILFKEKHPPGTTRFSQGTSPPSYINLTYKNEFPKFYDIVVEIAPPPEDPSVNLSS